MNRIIPIALGTIGLCLLSCASPEKLGRPEEIICMIIPGYDASKTITMKQDAIYIDNQSDPTECVIVPMGKYTMTGSDVDFDYYECETMLERRKLRDLTITKQWFFRGGIALAHSAANPIQAAVYTSSESDPRTKGITWVLGTAFTKKEGKVWTRSVKGN